jgi:uncharacterized repeat protein (TIGR03803 family)
MKTPQGFRRFALAALMLAVPVSTTAYAQTFSVLYNFGSIANDPIQPFYSGIVAQGRDGNLYSGTNGGGANDQGATFVITPAGTLTTLHSFGSSSTDGVTPSGGLTLGTDGNFYGTTYGGGFPSYGTVFKMAANGAITTLYAFTHSNDGALPIAPPVEGTDGNFYGTTCPLCNGTGNGTIYKITPSGVFKTLYQFDTTHGYSPEDPLVLGTDGNFYGTARGGGTNLKGVIFKVTSAGKLTILYNFDGTHGVGPIGPLVQGADGNFYGTTLGGGGPNFGVVYKMKPTGVVTVLHEMNGTTDGASPYAGLVQATDGNFYGVNESQGTPSAGCPNGCGTIFRITPRGVFSVLYNFDLTTGSLPYGNLVQHTNGLIYGTTQLGGTGGTAGFCNPGSCGVIFSLNIGAAHVVSTLTSAGKVGKTIEILGQGFTGTTGVSFGGTPAAFTASSDTYLVATVPVGALTGSVIVTTPGGTLTSNKQFRVTPQIASFSPPSGPVGTSVVIMGVSLTQATKVTFGAKAANFTVNSDTQVTATVPTGATTGKITVTTPGGTATSATSFTVTP